jgi:hypothetical protein
VLPPGNRIFVWTIPRSISTAFERAFLQRTDVEIDHEPFTGPYYFGPEKRSRRYAAQPPNAEQSYEAVARHLLRPLEPGKSLFIKDMAYAFDDSRVPADFLSHFQHTFLIRDPRRAIPSLYRISLDTARTGWDHFDPAEVGYAQLDTLARWVEERQPRPLIVVDSERLLARPEETLRAFCQAVGLPFDDRMMSWEPGPVEKWKTWAGWHDDAMRSRGFAPVIQSAPPNHDEAALPIAVRQCIEDAWPVYQRLRSIAL